MGIYGGSEWQCLRVKMHTYHITIKTILQDLFSYIVGSAVGLKIRVNFGLLSCVYVLINVMSFAFSLPFSSLSCTIILKLFLSDLLLFFQVSVSSVQLFNCVRLFVKPHGLQHSRPPCSSPSPRVYSNSCLLSQWCRPTISSSVVPFSSCPQALPASGSFPMSQLFAWGGHSIGVSASASVLPMNIQGWPPLGLTHLIPLQSTALSRVFSNTTVQKHQFFSAQLSL